jgi:hypothetical protein
MLGGASMMWLGTWLQWLKWRKSSKPTPSELDVIRALLPEDPRSKKLLLQATEAPEVTRRHLGETGYVMTISYVEYPRYLIQAAVDRQSPPLEISTKDGRHLSFTVRVLRGGFLNELTGIAQDGLPWPLRWDLCAAGISQTSSVAMPNWLPKVLSKKERADVLKALAAWAGLNPEELLSCDADLLSVDPPANPEEIAAAEAAQSLSFPAEYRRFVSLCNGFEVHGDGPCEPRCVLGVADVYKLDRPQPQGLFLVVTVLNEEGVVAVQCGGPGEGGTVTVRPGATRPEPLGSFREYVASVLAQAKA